VSDDEVFRTRAALHLTGDERLAVSRSAGLQGWRSALDGLALGPDDAVVLDAPVLAGGLFRAADVVRERFPRTGLVLVMDAVSARHGGMIRELAARVGGGLAVLSRACVPSPAALAEAIEGVRSGRVTLDPLVLGRQGPAGRDPFADRLSPREHEVLDLMACGLTNTAIAARLSLEVKTVERHINGIYTKLPEYSSQGHPRVSVVVAYLEMTRETGTGGP
jgi:DNA-binding NarL/FixJ family response regulator